MVNDRIGDFINQLKNASAIKRSHVSVDHTKMLESVAYTLKNAGYLSSVEKTGKGVAKKLEVEISKPIKTAFRISKPSRRMYSAAAQTPVGKGGLGVTVLTTPKGVMTSVEARAQHVGGEVLFTIV